MGGMSAWDDSRGVDTKRMVESTEKGRLTFEELVLVGHYFLWHIRVLSDVYKPTKNTAAKKRRRKKNRSYYIPRAGGKREVGQSAMAVMGIILGERGGGSNCQRRPQMTSQDTDRNQGSEGSHQLATLVLCSTCKSR